MDPLPGNGEGGGPQGTVIFSSVRGNAGKNIFDFLDENKKIMAAITMVDIRQLWCESSKGN